MSLQVEHKTEKGTVLFVKSPVFFNNFKLKKLWCNFLRFDFNNSCQDIVIENGNWQMIGLTSEVTEEQAKMMVDKMINSYKDYTDSKVVDTFSLFTALDSLKSLIQHLKVYEVNPFGNHRPYYMDYSSLHQYNGDCSDYDKAQEFVGKWIVLFKEN